jgi:hypothetical protein
LFNGILTLDWRIAYFGAFVNNCFSFFSYIMADGKRVALQNLGKPCFHSIRQEITGGGRSLKPQKLLFGILINPLPLKRNI